MSELSFETRIAVAKETLYQWHTMDGAFERLIPPWQDVRLREAALSIKEGTQARIEIKNGWIRHCWVAEHFNVDAGNAFSDRQIEGPFKAWVHRHQFVKEAKRVSRLKDQLTFALPGGFLGDLLMGSRIRKTITKGFLFRHERTRMDLERLLSDGVFRKGTVLITGHQGLVGSELSVLLRSLGYEVRGLTRRPRGRNEFGWDPLSGVIDERAFEGVGAVVHLAGENVAGGRWTADRRAAILASRRKGTELIAATMARVCPKGTVLVSASGANAYPTDGQPYDESGPKGEGFLSEVCQVWEEATESALSAGMRVVTLRIGVVLSPRGGALGKMLIPFRCGLGGRLGNGQQHFSWIAMDDLTEVMVRAIEDDSMSGLYNATAPEAVCQADFAKTLGRVLARPAVLPVPAFVLQTLLGKDFADEMLLVDLHVVPGRLAEAGYEWRFPRLEPALRFMLGKPSWGSREVLLSEQNGFRVDSSDHLNVIE